MKKSILVLLLLFIAQTQYAQTIVSATNQSDGVVVANSSFSTDPLIWMENNILEYDYNSHLVTGNLLAVSWMDAAGVSDFAFSQNNGDDWISGLGFNTLNAYTLSNYSYPSVIIGGAYASTGYADYYIGVVYVATDNNSVKHVYIDVWSITDPDPAQNAGAGTYTAICTVMLDQDVNSPIYTTYNINPGIPHADIVTEDGGNTDAFVVAWERSGTIYYNSLYQLASNCNGDAINTVCVYVPPL